MKKLKEILTNSIAIALAITHWIIVISSLAFEETQFFSKSISFHSHEPPIWGWLIFLNSPSLFILEFIFVPVLSVFERTLLIKVIGYSISVFCITFQWLFIGYCISGLIEFLKPKEVKSFLK